MELDSSINFEVEPVTKSNWNLFLKLFGDKGACGNCWCMYYRLNKTEFQAGKIDDGNKKSMKDIIWAGNPVGLIGLLEGEPIAWCAFAPDSFAWIGLYKSFERTGFVIADRTSKNRPMVRYYL